MAVSDETEHRERHNRWRITGISFTALLALFLILYQQTVVYLIGLWNHLEVGEYGHGCLVLAISIFLIIRNRRRLATLTPCSSYRAFSTVAVAGLLWLVSVLVDVKLKEHI